jgi:hypothetical protein
LIVAAENIPGVKRVNDHIAWIEPNSGTLFQSPEDTVVQLKSNEWDSRVR